MSKMTDYIVKVGRNLKGGLIRFPLSVGAACLLAIELIVNVETDWLDDDLAKMALVTLTMLLMLTISVLIGENMKGRLSLTVSDGLEVPDNLEVPDDPKLSDNLEKKGGNIIGWVLQGLSIVFAIIYFFVIPEELDTSFWTFYLSLNGSLVLLFLVVPYFYRRENFGFYCLRTGLKLAISAFYSGIIFAGVSGIVFAIESLFEVTFSDLIYLDVLIVSFVVFGIIYFLSTIEKAGVLVAIDFYPKSIRLLLLNIAIPLIYAYTLIMYAYFLRILINMEWPIGVVGQLVIWYGVAAWLTYFLLENVDLKTRWQKWFMSWHPFVFILPLLLMIVSLWIRISYYGVTQLRYYVGIAALWFIACTLSSLFFKKRKSMLLVITGMILLFLASFGPLGSVEVSFRSQEFRLEKLLLDRGLLSDGQIVARSVSEEDQDEITSILGYIDDLNKNDELSYLPEDFDMYSDMDQVFGFSQYHDKANRYYYYQVEASEVIAVNGLIREFSYPEESSLMIDGYKLEFSKQDIKVQGQKKELVLNLSDQAKQLVETYGYTDSIGQDALVITQQLADGRFISVYYRHIDIKLQNNEYEVQSGQGMIIIEEP